jgi:hypothetical protein
VGGLGDAGVVSGPGPGPQPQRRRDWRTAPLCLGGAASANGSAALAEPLRSPPPCWQEGPRRWDWLRGPRARRGVGRRLRVLGVRAPLACRGPPRPRGSEQPGWGPCCPRALLRAAASGLRPAGGGGAERCACFSSQSAKVCPWSADAESLSSPVVPPLRGCRGAYFIAEGLLQGLLLPGSFGTRQMPSDPPYTDIYTYPWQARKLNLEICVVFVFAQYKSAEPEVSVSRGSRPRGAHSAAGDW